MNDLYARSVFFVRDAEQALAFYTDTLGFRLDWNYQESGRAFVFQVSLLGFELILNQAEHWTQDRPGCGRVFIGLDDDQYGPLMQHIESRGIDTQATSWGAPTLTIRDLDGNEIFFWLPDEQRAALQEEIDRAAQAARK